MRTYQHLYVHIYTQIFPLEIPFERRILFFSLSFSLCNSLEKSQVRIQNLRILIRILARHKLQTERSYSCNHCVAPGEFAVVGDSAIAQVSRADNSRTSPLRDCETSSLCNSREFKYSIREPPIRSATCSHAILRRRDKKNVERYG